MLKNTRFLCSIVFGIVLVVFCTSCISSTRVRIISDVPGADVYVDGENVGKTPTEIVLSNGVWEDPEIVLKKDGYQDQYTTVNKELKVFNLVSGLILWWPSLLYVYGPKQFQHYILISE